MPRVDPRALMEQTRHSWIGCMNPALGPMPEFGPWAHPSTASCTETTTPVSSPATSSATTPPRGGRVRATRLQRGRGVTALPGGATRRESQRHGCAGCARRDRRARGGHQDPIPPTLRLPRHLGPGRGAASRLILRPQSRRRRCEGLGGSLSVRADLPPCPRLPSRRGHRTPARRGRPGQRQGCLAELSSACCMKDAARTASAGTASSRRASTKASTVARWTRVSGVTATTAPPSRGQWDWIARRPGARLSLELRRAEDRRVDRTTDDGRRAAGGGRRTRRACAPRTPRQHRECRGQAPCPRCVSAGCP